MDRRSFLADLSRYAVLCANVPTLWQVTGRPRLEGDPFTLGVASGDPLPDRCVIWTRLAPRPLERLGGMDGRRTVVGWEVAQDEAFSRVARSGRYTAAPELGFSVHVDVEGLEPDREYFYRFTLGEGSSPVGRLRTAPPPGSGGELRMAVASCQHWEQGLFTAYEYMATDDLHLVAHLGDYIYEYAGGDVPPVRRHHALEIESLEDYRARYAQYRSDPALQAAHALCPWIVTWDDHEVDNNYAGLAGENLHESVEQVRNRRAAAYQAWWENHAVRAPRADSWADLDIRRRLDWGGLARLHVLDTRQYRDDQACGDGTREVPCGEWADPARTLLGREQERWLLEGLGRPGVAWEVLAQQVMMAPFDRDPGEATFVSMDQWSGYPAARDHLLRAIGERAPNRTVVLTGDIHSSWVNELRAGFDRPDRDIVAAEFVGTSISSGGDGQEQWPVVAGALEANPHVRWQNARRGYLRCTVTPGTWTTDYRTIPWVSRPGAPMETASSWRVERGVPGVDRTA